MSDEIFEKGYKLLIRYFKEIGRYKDFINITTQNNPQYKKILKQEFNKHKSCGWYDFFTFTYFVGENYRLYGDYCLFNLKNNWIIFANTYCPEIFYIKY